MKFDKGFKFIDVNFDYEIIEYLEQFKMYRLKNINTGADNQLMTEEEIDLLVEYVDLTERKRRRNKKFMEEQEQREKEELERQLKEKKEYEFCYGYIDNMSAMQKGKILKTLNKQFRYDGKTMARKEFVVEQIKLGKQINNDNRFGYCFEWQELNHLNRLDTLFIEITKTEYDYARYLIDNKLVVSQVKAV